MPGRVEVLFKTADDREDLSKVGRFAEEHGFTHGVVVASPLGKAISAYASGRIADSYSQTSIAELRRELVGKLLAVPYQHLERLGAARAYAALTSDVMAVNSALQATANGLVRDIEHYLADAIPPDELRQLVRSAIDSHMDPWRLEQFRMVELEERETLKSMFGGAA